MTKAEFDFWLDKAKRDGASDIDIANYLTVNYLLKDNVPTPIYIINYLIEKGIKVKVEDTEINDSLRLIKYENINHIKKCIKNIKESLYYESVFEEIDDLVKYVPELIQAYENLLEKDK